MDARVQDVTEGILRAAMIFPFRHRWSNFNIHSRQCPTNDQAFRVGT